MTNNIWPLDIAGLYFFFIQLNLVTLNLLVLRTFKMLETVSSVKRLEVKNILAKNV